MAKERTINPATAALKAAKKKDIKKGKANVERQRAERFAKRNPFRIQQQIDELKQAEASGNLKPKDRQLLEQLQREHKAILRAREQLGDKAPQFHAPRRDGGGSGSGGVLGKRRRGDEDARSDSETDEDVRDIPMPKDVENMPPAPRRRARDKDRVDAAQVDLSLPKKPEIKSQVVYESAPVIRDLRKEPARAFVPSSVARNIKQIKGRGERLIEPEELDKLEKAGYNAARGAADEAVKEAEHETVAREAGGQYVEPERQPRHAENSPGEQVEDLEQASYHDAEMAVAEAVKEAEYEMMRRELEEGYTGDASREGEVAETQLRKVEMEEVEDEDG
ncbi:uncharacterized protein PV09_07708 [Verruconis gallopava]|uniref:Wbp11/ELF5/Saf1 N-terminal domain-containing protein n=1 Tax=Verruconis gallopava TaxID=253628 RepID=A0A0D2A1U5_9PEZI|nr:uncharacterized protein PV09_07708 [Verruconis gallopava]KIW00723.1 hypothetical protein PV09_07708 [Verruconis gallopava]